MDDEDKKTMRGGEEGSYISLSGVGTQGNHRPLFYRRRQVCLTKIGSNSGSYRSQPWGDPKKKDTETGRLIRLYYQEDRPRLPHHL
jgi:hypothetical protein